MWQFIASTFDHLALFVSTAIFRTASIVLLFVYLPWGVAIGWPAFFLANLMCGYQRYYINILFLHLIWWNKIMLQRGNKWRYVIISGYKQTTCHFGLSHTYRCSFQPVFRVTLLKSGTNAIVAFENKFTYIIIFT